MSASFPYVSPAVYLPSEPPVRVVDAGYYDNYGVDLGAAWIFANRFWILEHTSGVLIVQIRDSLSQNDRLGFPVEGDSFYARLFRGLQLFFSPIEGASSARNASSAFRNDSLIEGLSDYFSERTRNRIILNDCDIRARFSNRPADSPASLGMARRQAGPEDQVG